MNDLSTGKGRIDGSAIPMIMNDRKKTAMTGMAGIKDESPVAVLFAVFNLLVEAVTSDSRTRK